jgi:hypothetical protein
VQHGAHGRTRDRLFGNFLLVQEIAGDSRPDRRLLGLEAGCKQEYMSLEENSVRNARMHAPIVGGKNAVIAHMAAAASGTGVVFSRPLERSSSHVMLFKEDQRRWVWSQRKPNCRLDHDDGDGGVSPTRDDDTADRPSWNGKLKPTVPRIPPAEAAHCTRSRNTPSNVGGDAVTATSGPSSLTALPPLRGTGRSSSTARTTVIRSSDALADTDDSTRYPALPLTSRPAVGAVRPTQAMIDSGAFGGHTTSALPSIRASHGPSRPSAKPVVSHPHQHHHHDVHGRCEEADPDQSNHRRRRSQRLQSKSAIPGHIKLTMAVTSDAEEAAACTVALETFERRVPCATRSDDDDDHDAASHGVESPEARRRESSNRGAHRSSGGGLPSVHLRRSLSQHRHITRNDHGAESPLGGADAHDTAGPNPLQSLVVGIPLAVIYRTYTAQETQQMRRRGLTEANLAELVAALVPHVDLASSSIVRRAFRSYAVDNRGGNGNELFVTFYTKLFPELAVAVAPTYSNENAQWFFHVIAARDAARHAAQRQIRLRRQSQQSVVIGEVGGGTVSHVGDVAATTMTLSNAASKLSPSQRSEKDRAAARRASRVTLLTSNAKTEPGEGVNAAVAGKSAGMSSAPNGTTGAPVVDANATISVEYLQPAGVLAFSRAHVRTGSARAAWAALAESLSSESAHVVAVLQAMGVDTRAFNPPAPRSAIETKVLGAAPPPPFARVTINQWRTVVFSSQALSGCMRGLWYPAAAEH